MSWLNQHPPPQNRNQQLIGDQWINIVYQSAAEHFNAERFHFKTLKCLSFRWLKNVQLCNNGNYVDEPATLDYVKSTLFYADIGILPHVTGKKVSAT